MSWVLLTMEFTKIFLGGYHWQFSRTDTFATQDECMAAIVEIHKTVPGLTMICKREPSTKPQT